VLVAAALSIPLATSAAPLQKTKTILKVSGNVTTRTKYFSVPSRWQIHWSFKCGSTATSQVFELVTYAGPAKFFGAGIVAARVVKGGTGAKGTKKEHGAGRLFLAINTTCSFHVQVTS
jgi:hypothetical protein